jgi:hypothetical protein
MSELTKQKGFKDVDEDKIKKKYALSRQSHNVIIIVTVAS